MKRDQELLQHAIQEVLQIQKTIHQTEKTNQNVPLESDYKSGNPPVENGMTPSDLFSMQRSKLTIEQSKLANERTLLAYIRTSLAFFAASASLIQFFESQKLVLTGYSLLPVGALFLIIGFYSYSRAKKAIKSTHFIKE
ncbi:DUF202 domain-containing protein [Anaerobacillus sp. MEB173]|uniref:DUF202 domain-containing protein n=1 Tax=Anaerobacillus sp. MEB173 TaxID=3383345 RepID=UPI003F928B1B